MNSNCISVVVPMYNAENTILNTLTSIIRQSGVDYIKEIIVINDGSKDSSPEIVEKMAEDFPIIRLINKENEGVSRARNLGMEMATGEWIAFCDADDLWVPEKTELQANIIDSYNVDLIGGNYLDKDLKVLFKEIKELHKATTKELCIKMFPQTSTILMKRKIFEKIGGFDETMSHYEDGDYLLKIVGKYNYYYMPQKLVIYGGETACGGTGLSANTKKMNEGAYLSLKHTYERKEISYLFYLLMRVFYKLKSLRRNILLRK